MLLCEIVAAIVQIRAYMNSKQSNTLEQQQAGDGMGGFDLRQVQQSLSPTGDAPRTTTATATAAATTPDDFLASLMNVQQQQQQQQGGAQAQQQAGLERLMSIFSMIDVALQAINTVRSAVASVTMFIFAFVVTCSLYTLV
jgi:hypothetical protein